MSKRHDRRMMGRALALARLNQGLTAENPSVGCVILNADGYVIGEGVTGHGGRPHAEEVALSEAGARALHGTAYVTLEPCGQRSSGAPSCSELLKQASLARIVCAIRDPHPLGNGGIAALRSHGTKVEIGLGSRVAADLYRRFFASVKAD